MGYGGLPGQRFRPAAAAIPQAPPRLKADRMNPCQFDLFGPGASLPAGFRYQENLISPEEEAALIQQFADMAFEAFRFQGYTGKRRVRSFGWKYDFDKAELQRVGEIPAFLLPLRKKAAAFAGLAPSALEQVLLTEYGPSAAIGWHKDKAAFGQVVGISLASSCLFRLRRKIAAGWERASLVLEPRSAYLLQGPSRAEWEHSIPGVDSLRYSVTFRTLRAS
jgi:alkylated DNA repair dioxygenase AlkB